MLVVELLDCLWEMVLSQQLVGVVILWVVAGSFCAMCANIVLCASGVPLVHVWAGYFGGWLGM